MENVAVISFARTNVELNAKLTEIINGMGISCISYAGDKSVVETEMVTRLKDIKVWIDEHWKRLDALIFIGGVDVALRIIADKIEDKMKDPAVLVMDEDLQYIVPILGNHLGGGNDFAKELAPIIQARSIITTPKEMIEKFSIEKFAKDNGMEIGSRLQARTISTAILEGQHIGFYSEYPIKGEIPPELTECEDMKALSWFTQRIAIRSQFIVGMGLREGVPFQFVEELFLAEIEDQKIEIMQVHGIATLSESANEPALLELSDKYSIPILSFSKSELLDPRGVYIMEEDKNQSVNISERSAIIGSEGGELVVEKVTGKGATIAIARKRKTVYF